MCIEGEAGCRQHLRIHKDSHRRNLDLDASAGVAGVDAAELEVQGWACCCHCAALLAVRSLLEDDWWHIEAGFLSQWFQKHSLNVAGLLDSGRIHNNSDMKYYAVNLGRRRQSSRWGLKLKLVGSVPVPDWQMRHELGIVAAGQMAVRKCRTLSEQADHIEQTDQRMLMFAVET